MPHYQVIDAVRAKALLASKPVRVLDMRDHRSYRAGHVAGAVLLHEGLEKKLMEDCPWDQPLLLYCYRGVNSRQKAEHLARAGFEEVYMLENGFTAWPRDEVET